MAYSYNFTAANGTPPYTWAAPPALLPPGLSVDRWSGVLSGVPTVGGVFSFLVQASDQTGAYADVTCTVNMFGITSVPAFGVAGVPYLSTFTVFDGTYPFSWSVVAGALPAGLSINAATGDVSGIPTADGLYSATIQVVDGVGRVATRASIFLILATAPGSSSSAQSVPYPLGRGVQRGIRSGAPVNVGIEDFLYYYDGGNTPALGVSIPPGGALYQVPLILKIEIAFECQWIRLLDPTNAAAVRFRDTLGVYLNSDWLPSSNFHGAFGLYLDPAIVCPVGSLICFDIFNTGLGPLIGLEIVLRGEHFVQAQECGQFSDAAVSTPAKRAV